MRNGLKSILSRDMRIAGLEGQCAPARSFAAGASRSKRFRCNLSNLSFFRVYDLSMRSIKA